jgi:hypothetical protein
MFVLHEDALFHSECHYSECRYTECRGAEQCPPPFETAPKFLFFLCKTPERKERVETKEETTIKDWMLKL